MERMLCERGEEKESCGYDKSLVDISGLHLNPQDC